jgi:pyridoxamine 5'-phosphate oxidase family protein
MKSFAKRLFYLLSYVDSFAVVAMVNPMFSEREVKHLKSQRLARITTAAIVSSKKENKQKEEQGSIKPDVVPVGFDFDGDYLYVSGMNLLKSTKYKNVLKNNRVAIVIDDLRTVDPWDPRGMKIYGIADIVTRQGGYMEGTGHSNHQYIRITPNKKRSWGIEEPVFVEGVQSE